MPSLCASPTPRPLSHLDASDEASSSSSSSSSSSNDASDEDEDDDLGNLSPKVHLEHFEDTLGPFFSVLKDHSHVESLPPPTTAVRVDEGIRNEEEDKLRRQLLGIPRGERERTSKRSRAMPPPVPMLLIPASEPNGRPPSLYLSSTSEDGCYRKTKSPPLGPKEPVQLFLNRDGSLYPPILAFLRDNRLPSELSLPVRDPSTLSLLALHPPLAFNILTALRNLEAEAEWLGIDALVGVCRGEREKVVGIVRWLEKKRVKEGVEEERRRRIEVMSARKKEGWI